MEQMEAIETNCSLVEDLQGTVGAQVLSADRVLNGFEIRLQTGVMSQACEVFGRNWWMWWLPTNPNLSPNLCGKVCLKLERRMTWVVARHCNCQSLCMMWAKLMKMMAGIATRKKVG
eukprot:GHVN01033026.1.p2 GENE.GHVN01033026.1~~GHVN01033026.1.p2  ORF type:complete len:117 (-),score=14.58 GHVN01033026.1:1015-1365(-)